MSISSQFRVLDSSLSFVLDLDDHASGYEVVSVSMPDEIWRRSTSASPVIDGNVETQSVLDAGRIDVVLRVRGASWVQVEQRRLAMRTAVTAWSWYAQVILNGVTTVFKANRADLKSLSTDATDIDGRRRTVVVSFPVQPNPTITGV